MGTLRYSTGQMQVDSLDSKLDPQCFSSFEPQVLSIEFRVSSFEFRVSSFEFQVLSIEFRVSSHSNNFSWISNRDFEKTISSFMHVFLILTFKFLVRN